ncbi:MAG: hypothetical protein QMD86_01375 [Patescibacteria group bacterium]|nr:hypothetical protein [Patescibacteria group bacterium]
MKKNIFKNKNIIFIASVALIAIFLVVFTAYSINFLKSKLKLVLETDLGQQNPHIGFQFEKLKEMGIIESQ